jgi:hypothetical protein
MSKKTPPRLVSKQKMVVMWDVCTEHKDACWFLGTWLARWMPEHCPHIIMLFVPANLTGVGQPLDIGFNFEFKDGITSRRNLWIACARRRRAKKNAVGGLLPKTTKLHTRCPNGPKSNGVSSTRLLTWTSRLGAQLAHLDMWTPQQKKTARGLQRRRAFG